MIAKVGPIFIGVYQKRGDVMADKLVPDLAPGFGLHDDQHEMSAQVGPTGEMVPLRDFYMPHKPVYAPGFGPADPPQVSMTRQEFADEADINKIMAKYEGAWPPVPYDHDPSQYYLDVSEVPDLMTAHAFLDQATKAFMTLPAKVRREMNDDPREFVKFASDPANVEQMREWKLAAPKAPPVKKDPTEGLVAGVPPEVSTGGS